MFGCFDGSSLHFESSIVDVAGSTFLGTVPSPVVLVILTAVFAKHDYPVLNRSGFTKKSI